MSGRVLFLLGATHQRTPLAVREKLALAGEAAEAMRVELRALPGLAEFVVLNTCNRVEFYGVGESAETVAAVERAFCARQQFDLEEFGRFRLRLTGCEAVQHLLEVAGGLDSQMLGETEIFGQVKAAYAEAQSRGFAGPVLHRVFQKAFQAAKAVRTETAITSGQVSVASVAVELALDIYGALEPARVLLLGAGEIGEKTARAFQSRGAGRLDVASRHIERAAQLAEGLGAAALSLGQAVARLGEYDIVVCCTAAPEAVLHVAEVERAMAGRASRPLLLADLAMPRDVASAVGELPGVYLYNLDDLARIADENSRARACEVARARAMLETRAAALWVKVQESLGAGVETGSGSIELPSRAAS